MKFERFSRPGVARAAETNHADFSVPVLVPATRGLRVFKCQGNPPPPPDTALI